MTSRSCCSDYQPGPRPDTPADLPRDYRGILDERRLFRLAHDVGPIHLGCMAHSRRRFVNALKDEKQTRRGRGAGAPVLRTALPVERQARDKKPEHGETQADSFAAFAQQHSVPILNALKTWLDEIAPKVLPDSKLGDAVSYTLNQWEYLTRYTEDGRMPIDNNLLERDIRVFGGPEVIVQSFSKCL